ncbi:MAG: pyruvate ferredoxin oxidoreductase, partial [Candidatus Ratteibacteria bacterium]|nr:pyruvate ferredoxin oxidoreductase [Candidatus Ratteibacteria bacterium]
MPTLKELAREPESLSGGHRLCAGCGASIAARQVLLAAPKPIVVTCATGCLEVATTIFPYTAWEMPWMHSAFENAAATCSGIE